MLRKALIGSLVMLLASGLLVTGASAQKQHASKGIWRGMIGNLNDLNDINGSLMVFDMQRVAEAAGRIAGRNEYLAGLTQLPQAMRDRYARLAEAAADTAASAEMGEENDVVDGVAAILKECNSCHYEARDSERREKAGG